MLSAIAQCLNMLVSVCILPVDMMEKNDFLKTPKSQLSVGRIVVLLVWN